MLVCFSIHLSSSEGRLQWPSRYLFSDDSIPPAEFLYLAVAERRVFRPPVPRLVEVVQFVGVGGYQHLETSFPLFRRVRRYAYAYEGVLLPARIGRVGRVWIQIYGLSLLGKRIPEDISLITHETQYSRFYIPRLTTIAQDFPALAEASFDLLEKMMLGEKDLSDREIDYKLIVRESVRDLFQNDSSSLAFPGKEP